MTGPESNWPTARLGALGKLIGGGTPSRTRPDYFSGDVPWLTGQDVPEDTVDHVSAGRERISREAIEGSATNLVPVNSVLVTTRVTVGKVAVVATPLCFSQDVTAILLQEPKLADPFFVAYCLLSRRERLLRLNQGSTISGITREALAQEQIPLPPLSEQRRVVEILREAEAVRRLRATADRLTAELIPALFHEMFGDPPAWLDPVKLGTAVRIVGGGTPSRAETRYFQGDIPWATSKDIKRWYLDDAQEHINQEAIDNSATNLVPAGTILLVVKSKILMHSLPMGITTRSFCFGQDLKGLVPQGDFTPEFIMAALSVQKDDILRKARGVNTEGLTIEILHRLTLPRATPDRMREFQRRAWTVRDVVAESEKTSGLFDAALASLLSHAFTGELTASWRQQHARQLAAEARQRDEALRQVGAVVSAPAVAAAPEPDDALPADGIYAELTAEQRDLLRQLRHLWRENRATRIFTHHSIAGELTGPLRHAPDAIRRHLDVFAARGLLIPLNLRDEASAGPPEFSLAWRAPQTGRAFMDDEDHLRESELRRLAERWKRRGA